ncbi:hypothetical protein CDAR_587961 [Caerostris darwini]|uniref:Uncharacterized protein n=1 Tax=Caerostris darwini TaxID=1538125 RepID=A0AAV4Q0A3_9ARAC|nr:hypothetical protein CDAR_587961 [Caerostris darwini]
MNSFGLSLAATLMLIGVALALPNQLSSALKDMPDLTQPENTMMGQRLKEMGVEICPDKLHLCPATADCCEKDGKWDCCPKTAANAPNQIFLDFIVLFQAQGSAATSWDSSGIAAPHSPPNANGGDAGLISGDLSTLMCSLLTVLFECKDLVITLYVKNNHEKAFANL